MASSASVNSSAVQVLRWKDWQSFYHRACTQKCQCACLSTGLGATRESTWLKCRHSRIVLGELSWNVVESSFGTVMSLGWMNQVAITCRDNCRKRMKEVRNTNNYWNSKRSAALNFHCVVVMIHDVFILVHRVFLCVSWWFLPPFDHLFRLSLSPIIVHWILEAWSTATLRSCIQSPAFGRADTVEGAKRGEPNTGRDNMGYLQ